MNSADSLLMLSDWLREPRMPVTTISSNKASSPACAVADSSLSALCAYADEYDSTNEAKRVARSAPSPFLLVSMIISLYMGQTGYYTGLTPLRYVGQGVLYIKYHFVNTLPRCRHGYFRVSTQSTDTIPGLPARRLLGIIFVSPIRRIELRPLLRRLVARRYPCLPANGEPSHAKRDKRRLVDRNPARLDPPPGATALRAV